MKLSLNDALIVIDIQNDYVAGGAVPVEGAGELAVTITTLARRIQSSGVRIIATQDWHAENHLSFTENGGQWPTHCVQGTAGAAFHPDLKMPVGSLVIRKGVDPRLNAGSAFTGSKLEETLRRYEVNRLLVAGVPAELTVLETVLDGQALGFEVVVVEDCIAPLTSDDSESSKAIDKMKSAEITFVKADDLIA